MAVSLVGAGTKVVWSGGAVTFVEVPLPLGIAEGDTVVLFGHTISTHGTSWVQPSVWTTRAHNLVRSPVGTIITQCWTRTLGPSPDDHVSVSFTAVADSGQVVAVVYRGVTQVASRSSNSSLNAPSVSLPGTAGGVALYGWCALLQTGTTVFDISSDLTSVVGTSPAQHPVIMAAGTIGTGNVAPAESATLDPTRPAYSFTSVTLALGGNTPPNAPTLLSPANGAVFDLTQPQRFRWQFSDPDPGDTQSKYDLLYRQLIFMTFTPWVTITRNLPSTFYDFAGGTLAAGDYEWYVVTYDAVGAEGPPSEHGFFTAADAVDAPTITYPISGGTVAALDRVDWSYPDQDAYQVRRVADLAGDPDPSTIYYDTGEVDDPDTRTVGLAFETNDRYEHIQVRTKFGGIWSDWTDDRVLVSYTEPAVTLGQVFEGDDGATIALSYSIPTAGEGVPAATSVDIRVSTDGGLTSILPANLAGLPTVADVPGFGSATYWLPESGVEYCFQFVTHADNGASSASEWITMFGLAVGDVV